MTKAETLIALQDAVADGKRSVAWVVAATGRVHTITVLDPGEQPREPRPGELRLNVDPTVFGDYVKQWAGDGSRDPIQEWVSDAMSLAPPDDTFAVVQNGVVVNVITGAAPELGHLEAELGAGPNTQVVPTKGAVVAIDAIYTGAAFINPVPSILHAKIDPAPAP